MVGIMVAMDTAIMGGITEAMVMDTAIMGGITEAMDMDTAIMGGITEAMVMVMVIMVGIIMEVMVTGGTRAENLSNFLRYDQNESRLDTRPSFVYNLLDLFCWDALHF